VLIVGALLAASRNEMFNRYASGYARLAVIAIGSVCE
jgi:hypothetical protein